MQAQAKAAQELYKQAGASSGPAGGDAGTQGSGGTQGDVIDAEVIDDEKAETK
jgi:hypothetical protein